MPSVVVALTAGVLAVRALGGDAGSEDLKTLQGEWQVVEVDGKKAQGVQANVKVSIKQDRIVFWDFGTPDEPATLRLDATKTPKHFDVLPDPKEKDRRPVLGIYELKGDTLKLRQSSANPSVRPKDFEGKGGDSVMILKRLKK
jgi:uncharacterized protein (TIGR03067 family)